MLQVPSRRDQPLSRLQAFAAIFLPILNISWFLAIRKVYHDLKDVAVQNFLKSFNRFFKGKFEAHWKKLNIPDEVLKNQLAAQKRFSPTKLASGSDDSKNFVEYFRSATKENQEHWNEQVRYQCYDYLVLFEKAAKKAKGQVKKELKEEEGEYSTRYYPSDSEDEGEEDGLEEDEILTSDVKDEH
ncbi:hypothetical protein BT63DRAFT_453420 [Microthyrium microscopicum]|uniref:Uncharacterized protein n=1 Tax=Microthyrium microscopicum TaxID=703497 RepID=A0A6A6UHK4_9PEZI|nr:hypothetical protein BT63DRAFT_453420 [Microthyrium microscopicum]